MRLTRLAAVLLAATSMPALAHGTAHDDQPTASAGSGNPAPAAPAAPAPQDADEAAAAAATHRARAMQVLATMVGGLVLARATAAAQPGLSEELLTTLQDQLIQWLDTPPR